MGKLRRTKQEFPGSFTRAWVRTSDRTWDIDDRFAADSMQVSEPEEEYSGLLDAQGNPLYRQRARVGFLKFDD